MGNKEITFKATNNGLILMLNDDIEFDIIYSQIESKLDSSGQFFKGTKMEVLYKGRKLSETESDILRELMLKKTGASEIELKEEIREPEIRSTRISRNSFFYEGVEEGRTKFYKGTVRSGQLISYDGNIVIVGDVNPGAEVIAEGSILIMGALRGMVHAGCQGNEKAIVACLNMQPVQLRIANVITRSPDETMRKGVIMPEIAFIKDDIIYLEGFLPNVK